MNPESRLAEIVSALEGAGISCLVMGGHAVRFYGLSRNTIDFDCLNPPQATRLQPVVRRVSPVGLQPVPLSRLAGVVKRMMIFVNDP